MDIVIQAHARTFPRRLPGSRSRGGFTLIEAVVAMMVFTLLALGLTAGALQAQRLAHSNILRNSAYTIAQSYLEQIRSMSSVSIEEAIDAPATTPLPAKRIDVHGTVGDISLPVRLFLDGSAPALPGQTDGSNVQQVTVDLRDTSEVTMEMHFDVDIEEVSSQAFLVEIRFSYEAPSLTGGTLRYGEVKMITAKIKTEA